ncbi:MAG: ABC transporter ATP-binding protein [bacterium]
MSSKEKSKTSQSKAERKRVSLHTLVRLYRVFGRHYKKHWKLFARVYSGLLLTILMALVIPWPLKLILDYVILQNPLPERAAFVTQWLGTDPLVPLAALALAFLLLRIFESFANSVHKVGLLSAGEMIATDIRERVFIHLQRLSLSFQASARSGDLIYRLTSDIDDTKTILVQLPDNFIYRLVMVFSHVSLMVVLEWRLALLAFSIIPILYFVNRRIGSDVKEATAKKRSKETEVSSIIAENVTAMALVQAYGREDLQQARFASENRESLHSEIEARRLAKLFKRISDNLAALGTCAVVGYGGLLALDGLLLPGTLVLFVAYLRNLYRPIEKFAEMILDVAKAQVAGERLLELVECDMVIQDAPNASPAPPFSGRVEFREVSFGYHPGVEVLKNLCFVAEPGETIALVGHSGAGKSTLISLLLRFYDPQKGQILIDGRDLRQIVLKSLRDQVTILMQEAKLFNKTVRENIGFGKAEATEEEIIRAATLALAHDFIMQMPDGYDTVIEEGGENLSGGQKQRLNIARAIIRNTPILILDEPATALDAKSEANIHAALDELTHRKTTFIIAHKFSTIANASKILMLEDGQLAAHGTHEELLRTSREYRELYELQQRPPLELAATARDEESKAAVLCKEQDLVS